MWKIMFFFFKPHKYIALHQILFYLAMSYDPFKEWTIMEPLTYPYISLKDNL